MAQWRKKIFSWPALWLCALAIACATSLFFPDSACWAQDLSRRCSGPSTAHWLGTDALGRDMLLRLLRGGCLSLAVGFSASAIAMAIGTVVGILSGYGGGSIDSSLMGLVDVLCALPITLLTMLFLIFFGKSLPILCLAIGLTGWFTFSRVLRSLTADLRRRTFILSAKGLGQSHFSVICRHVIPNLLPTIGAYGLLLLPDAILTEAFLSFLGLGVPMPRSSWGNMIVDGIAFLQLHPMQLVWPALFLMATLLSLTSLSGVKDFS
ncbi:MAG: ABC transporter permease [Puniceicoccales bacterium]|nr:ABC transporter permease [Puniceicoccales bacterium]